MKNYYRVMLGQKSAYAEEAHRGSFIAAGFNEPPTSLLVGGSLLGIP